MNNTGTEEIYTGFTHDGIRKMVYIKDGLLCIVMRVRFKNPKPFSELYNHLNKSKLLGLFFYPVTEDYLDGYYFAKPDVIDICEIKKTEALALSQYRCVLGFLKETGYGDI